jgi:hypothetical protein
LIDIIRNGEVHEMRKLKKKINIDITLKKEHLVQKNHRNSALTGKNIVWLLPAVGNGKEN